MENERTPRIKHQKIRKRWGGVGATYDRSGTGGDPSRAPSAYRVSPAVQSRVPTPHPPIAIPYGIKRVGILTRHDICSTTHPYRLALQDSTNRANFQDKKKKKKKESLGRLISVPVPCACLPRGVEEANELRERTTTLLQYAIRSVFSFPTGCAPIGRQEHQSPDQRYLCRGREPRLRGNDPHLVRLVDTPNVDLDFYSAALYQPPQLGRLEG